MSAYETDSCGWCHGACMVTLWHKQFAGDVNMVVEVVNHKTGHVAERRIAGRISIHCRQCPEGERRYGCFDEEQRRKLWTTRHMATLAECYGYVTTDPTYRSTFQCEEDAIAWMAGLGSVAATFPAIPRPQRSTPEKIADQLRQRAERESAA